MTEHSRVLLPAEAEAYIEALHTFDITDIGSHGWNQQHERVEKLNMQAVLTASLQEDEFVKEFLTTYEKIPVLIHELLVTEIWKQKVFPEFVNLQLKQTAIFPMYMVLYHEATVVNLLQTVLYHEETAQSGDDAMLDLTDYCYRKLTYLMAKTEEDDDDEEEELSLEAVHKSANETTLQELQKLEKKLRFDISIKAMSILRYIVDYMHVLPLSVMTRMLNTHDFPILLVELVSNAPWTRSRNGKLQKYIDNKWQTIADHERFTLTKLEGQVWLALFQLLMTKDCQNKYELNPYRKNTILKLRSHLTEVMLDQMPVLAQMQIYLEQLSISEPPPVKKDLVLEQVPEIRDNILAQNKGRWVKIATQQSKTHFNPSKEDMRLQAKRLADTYNFDVLQDLITEPPKCAVCGQQAMKRCSRCQNEWYCRRECQVSHWKKHKTACDLLADSVTQLQMESKVS